MTYPEPKRGKYSESRNGTGEVSKQRLSAARTVLKWAPELGDGVLNGAHLNGTVPSRFRARKHQTLLALSERQRKTAHGWWRYASLHGSSSVWTSS